MRSAYDDVIQFHATMGAPVGDKERPDVSRRQGLRKRLIAEELRELSEALEVDDVVATADALADLAYVVIGAAVEWGIDLPAVFAEVHRSNMTKSGGVTRDDGKILKGPDYSPPDIARVLGLAKGAS